MRLLIALLALPAFASLTITSATVDVTGLVVTASFNGNSLTGSTSGCLALTGGNANSNTISSSVISGGATTVIITPADPLYGAQTINVALTPCALTGSTGSSVSSNVNAANSSEWQAACGAPMSTYAQYDGSPACGDQFGLHYPGMVSWNSALGSISVNVANASAVQILAWHGGNSWCLQQDGADIGTRQTQDGSSTFSVITLASGLSGTHLLRMLGCSGQSAYQNVLIAAVRFVGGTLTGSIPAARPTITCYGDSICGSGSAPDDSRTLDFWLVALNNGYAAQIYTSSGTLVSGAGGLATTTSKIQLFGSGAPAITVLEGDVNDQAASVATGPGSTNRNAISAMIAGAKAIASPATTLLVRGVLPNLDGNSANTANYVADQAAASAAAGVCMYHTGSLASGAPDWISAVTNSSPCLVPPAQDTVDHLHPCGGTSLSQDGYGKIANREAPIFAGYISGSSFTFSGGAAGGQASSPSPAFTVTAAGANTFFMDPVTISSTGGADTICIIGGTCGTGSGSLPASWGSHTFQFTLTPSSAGARTVSFTGLADCWTAPASATYTATSAATFTLAAGVNQ